MKFSYKGWEEGGSCGIVDFSCGVVRGIVCRAWVGKFLDEFFRWVKLYRFVVFLSFFFEISRYRLEKIGLVFGK